MSILGKDGKLHDYVYRADTREPEEIKKTGFKAWVPLDLNQAKELLEFYTNARELKDCSFKPMVDRETLTLSDKSDKGIMREGEKRGPHELAQVIIRSKIRGPQVSTDLSTECGGYLEKKAYGYKIDARDMRVVPWKQAIPQGRGESKSWPDLVLNADDLAGATKIALKAKGGTEEVSFLTAIEHDRIIDVFHKPEHEVGNNSSVAAAPQSQEQTLASASRPSVRELKKSFQVPVQTDKGSAPAPQSNEQAPGVVPSGNTPRSSVRELKKSFRVPVQTGQGSAPAPQSNEQAPGVVPSGNTPRPSVHELRKCFEAQLTGQGTTSSKFDSKLAETLRSSKVTLNRNETQQVRSGAPNTSKGHGVGG